MMPVRTAESAASFHGSYPSCDVTFLLDPLPQSQAPMVPDLLEKERLIQSGSKHYSEMLSPEHVPAPSYLALFYAACDANLLRVAHDIFCLARKIRCARPADLTLVSLARAGTPMGVILQRVLRDVLHVEVAHYSISIIRDRGIDIQALNYILARHAPQSLTFVDGWTAKGSILGELQRSLAALEGSTGVHIAPDLFVLSDLAGVALASGTSEDYLIPSALLNASVSGLVSRSFLNKEPSAGGFHGCVFYKEWLPHDLSNWFVDQVSSCIREHASQWSHEPLVLVNVQEVKHRATEGLSALALRHNLPQWGLIKPGLGEATRAMLRRTPQRLILRDPADSQVRHLVQLAQQRSIPMEVDPAMAMHAVAVIRSLSDA